MWDLLVLEGEERRGEVEIFLAREGRKEGMDWNGLNGCGNGGVVWGDGDAGSG